MSETMLFAVLRMPVELWRDDPIDVHQRHSRYLEAAERLQQLMDENEELRKTIEKLETNFRSLSYQNQMLG